MTQDSATAGTLAERLAGEIAERIIAGELPAGARLDEQSLADRHSMSRTPVREALRQLQATGLIEMRPRRGAIVAQPTQRDLEDLFVAMGEIEASCARLAALGMTPIERRRLEALHEAMGAMAAAADIDAYAEANVAMHGAIYEGAHNAALAEIALNLRRRLAPFRRAQFRAPGRLELSHREHARVVDAIVEGRAAEAHAAMLHHVTLVEISAEAVSRIGQAKRGGR